MGALTRAHLKSCLSDRRAISKALVEVGCVPRKCSGNTTNMSWPTNYKMRKYPGRLANNKKENLVSANTNRRILGWLTAFVLSAFTAACGGGGGSSGSSSSAAGTTTTYSSVAGAGEFIQYQVNPTALTYSYTITESQYGLTGQTGSGTLIKLADGTFLAGADGNARVAILPNGLLLAGVRANFGGTTKTVPVVGISNPVTTFAAAAGTYNFVQRACSTGAAGCFQTYGTFVIRSDGTWSSCDKGNLAAGPCPTTAASGTLNNEGAGKFSVIDSNGGVNFGTAIAFNSNGQNVIVLDLKDQRPTGFGLGILVGSSQQAIVSGSLDGVWVAGASTGDNGSFRLTGTNIAYIDIDNAPTARTTSVTYNSPWAGFGQTVNGIALLAGSGVYVYGSGTNYSEVGFKIN